MTIAFANGTIDSQSQWIKDREERREALRARIFGAKTDPEPPKALIAELETEIKTLDTELKELKSALPETPG